MTDRSAIVLSVDAQRPDDEIVGGAARVVADGGLVAFPTETFYGLGADPWNDRAVEALFEAKGRPSGAPILLLLASEEQALAAAARLPGSFEKLARAFWPGPLTLVLPARGDLPVRLTAGRGTIGLRVSGSLLARALPRALGRPITGTSANASGRDPARTAGEVKEAMGEGFARINLVLDGGETPGKAPSTVVDLTGDGPTLVREGAISYERVLATLR